MAVLSDADREEVWAECMQLATGPLAIAKAPVREETGMGAPLMWE